MSKSNKAELSPAATREGESGTLSEPWYTIDQYCQLKRISRATYFKARSLGYGPKEIVIPGTTVVRISASAAREHEARLQAAAEGKQVVAERKARSSTSTRAGKLAAESPEHICHRKTRRKRKLAAEAR